MKVSLVINTYNRMHTLPNTLKAIQGLRYPNFEVIIVDGPSTDGTEDYIHSVWGNAVKFYKCKNANLSESRNIGIHYASGDIVVFTDDDGIPEPNWLDEIVSEYVADPMVAAVGGFVRDNSGVGFQAKYIVSNRDTRSDTLIGDPALLPDCKPGSFSFVGLIGVNSSFRRSALLEIGGFDEEYAYFLDETDVVLRLVDLGYKVVINPKAEVHHKYASSHIRTQKGLPRTWFFTARSIAYFLIQNALPKTPLLEIFRDIRLHKIGMQNTTNWALQSEMISADEAKNLLATLEQGISDGIKDAFSLPYRLLRKDFKKASKRDWRRFPKLMEIENRLKIAFVSDLYPPRECGGVAIFIRQLAEKLALLGHEVTVITFSDSDIHTVDFENGLWVHRIVVDPHTEVSCSMMPRSLAINAEAVGKEIERINDIRQFDWVVGTIWDMNLASIIQSGQYRTAMYLVTSYALMLNSKPEWFADDNYYQNHVLKMIEAEKWGLQNVDLVFSSTNAISNDMNLVYDMPEVFKNVVIQPFGINYGDSTDNYERSDDFIHILYVGRFEKRKGIEDLLSIIPNILINNDKVIFRLVGNNMLINAETGLTYWCEFSQKYEDEKWFDRIVLCGVVDDEQLEREYATSDFFVAPSRYESFGLIYLEAMKYGKACIGCVAGGIPEVVVDDKTGVLVPPASPEHLQRAIQYLIDNPHIRDRMGKNGLQRFEDFFTIDKFANGFINNLKLRM